MPGILDLLKRSLALYKAHGGLFAGYVAWLLLPFAGIILTSLVPDPTVAAIGFVVFTIAELVLWVYVTIILTLAVRDLVQGKPANTAGWYAQMRAIIYPVALVYLLQLLVVVGGFILLVIPGLVFAAWYLFAPSGAILDGKRGMDALSWSKALIKGRFWSVVWRMVAGIFVISLVEYFLISIIMLVIASATNTPLDLIVSADSPLWTDILISVTDAFTLPVWIIYFTLLYLNLCSNPSSASKSISS